LSAKIFIKIFATLDFTWVAGFMNFL